MVIEERGQQEEIVFAKTKRKVKENNYVQVCNIAQHCAFEKDVPTTYIRELRCMFHLEKSVEL